MRLTKEQFAKIEHLMPIPRRKPEVSNYDFLCALLYIIETAANGGLCRTNTEIGTRFMSDLIAGVKTE